MATEVRALGRRALCLQADIADADQVGRMFRAIDQGLGTVTGLVNNAGIVDAGRALPGHHARALAARLFDVCCCAPPHGA